MIPARPLALAALAAALLLPFIPGVPPYWLTLGSYVALAGLVALGLVVLTGVGGVVSFGQAMFVGFGAYATAILSVRHGWPALLTLPVSVGITAALAWCIGAITLRLRGHYLPVATIAWNISFFYLAGALDLFGRSDGIADIPPIRVGSFAITDGPGFYLLAVAVLMLALRLTANLLDSRVGRAIRALQGGALAAESFGIDTARARNLAFVYAAVLAAISGWLYAHLQRAISPSPFGITASIDYLLMAVAGGAGHLGGAVLGAALVTLVRDKLQDVLPWLAGVGGNYESIVFGIVLIGIFQFAPEGIWPHLSRLWRPGRRRDASAAGAPQASPARERLDPGEALLAVSGLSKSFGGLVAVDDVAFRVCPGEIVGLIGPNGAGKSTTFNLVTGVLPASGGRISLQGREIGGWPARRIAGLGLARTFQHVKLAAGMSVLENVAIGRHLLGSSGAIAALLRLDRPEEARIFARARTELDRVGLLHLADSPAGELALGQQRLVEIARALCLDPVLLLLDEPAAGLRHAEKEALASLLRRVKAEGVAILLVEHDMDFVMRLTDRLVVLNFGRELARGRPEEIQRHPAVLEAYLGGPA